MVTFCPVFEKADVMLKEKREEHDMVTVSLRLSAKQMCKPHTVNRIINAVKNRTDIANLFWPRLVKDKSINNGKKVGAKLDPENRDFLRKLKKTIKDKFGIFVSFSMLVLMQIFSGHSDRRKIMSLNVQGYKADTLDFTKRLKGITGEIKKVMPDMLFLQEFRIGEYKVFLKILKKELRKFYRFIVPVSYKKKDDYNNCICMMLVAKNIKRSRPYRITAEDPGYRLRYNLVETDDYICLNAWMPQIVNNKQDRIELADKMWNEVVKLMNDYAYSDKKFILAGDLNAYIGGPHEDKILILNNVLKDTKKISDISKPTGPANVLDYVFINRSASENDMVRTKIYEPSIKWLGLSDHDALITTITEVPD